jgi:N-glycosylase/DNA lyase
MAANANDGWHDLAVPPCELRLRMTLDNGQCFEWVRIKKQAQEEDAALEYAGVLGECLISLRQTATSVWYKQHWPQDGADSAQLDARVRDYLSLPHVCPRTGQRVHDDKVLARLYDTWSTAPTATAHFRRLARIFPGVRLLRQDPLTTLFSFIASSNNNIARIRQMLQTLRVALGVRLDVSPAYATLHLGDESDRTWHAFPTLASLCSVSEERLRQLGFGYRAPYVTKTARLVLAKGGANWLATLRTQSRESVETDLVALHGVGPKVAACVALFSLDQLDALPVDTHVWQIALRDYAAESRRAGVDLTRIKSLTPTTMRHVGDVFRTLFGPLTGWAQCLLFLGELPEFRLQLVEDEKLAGVLPTKPSKKRTATDASSPPPPQTSNKRARKALV